MTRAAQINQAREQLAAVAHELELEELRVLVLLARRLRQGQRDHGVLRLETDPRDFERERGEEVQDLLVYTAIAELRRLVRSEATP